MFIKICGIQDIKTAKIAEANGAHLLGFVFAPSSRKIAPALAAEIVANLAETTKTVGVFVNETAENIEAIAKQVKLDYIQLHGDEDPAFAARIPYPIIKAFSINDAKKAAIASYPCEYIIIDSPRGKYRGGTGQTFDWQQLEALEIDPHKLILAGGLHADNIQEAIQAVYPAGVDVSSGVETNGKKDPQKITTFIRQAKEG